MSTTITPTAEQGRVPCLATLKLIERDGDDAVQVDENDRFAEWRMCRRGRFCFVKKQADERLPRRIDAYEVDDSPKFLLDPQRKLFSVQYEHNGEPPDLHLMILQPCEQWFGEVMLTLALSLNAKPN
jgi:hypothetical protein